MVMGVKLMNSTGSKLTLVLGMLILTTSCTATSNTYTTTQQQATEASNRETVSQIKIDGSSTVYPITEAVANQFQQANLQYAGRISVNFSGTSAGFKKFCTKETDISNASRPILKAEIETCKKNGVRFIELPVAYDALTIAVNSQNTWAKDVTIAELKKIWEPAAEGKITRWNQIRPNWPDKPIVLYGAGKDSGTFDYFTEVVVGKTRASRIDYTSSEDDLALVRGVVTNPNALGYFGYAYYKDNKNNLRALAIDNGKGPITPSRETVGNSQYQPLARPLFIYVNAEAAKNKPEVKEFVDFYMKQASITVGSVGYMPLPSKAYELTEKRFLAGKEGTVFAGQEQVNLTISELLQKEAK
jgi:phosphate transport system substrate-binding protein